MPYFVPTPPPTTDIPLGPGVPGAVIHSGQVALGDILLGTTDEFGVEWVLQTMTGWDDTPPTTSEVEQRVADNGGWFDAAYLTPRVIELGGTILAGSWATCSLALDRLMAAIPLSSLGVLWVAEGARTLQAEVRQEGDPLVTRIDGYADFSLSLVAPDPRRYTPDVTHLQTALPELDGGLTVGSGGLTVGSGGLSVGAVVTSGVLSAVNIGNFATAPLLTVMGPSPAGTITHIQSGQVVSFPDPVPEGHRLVIDVSRRTALLDGTEPRRITGSWFDYAPGQNDVAFSAANFDPAALLVSEHRSAYK